MKPTVLVALLALAACEAPPQSSDRVKTISTGDRFTRADYEVPGKVVILDFAADW